jgi:hypothetical protein
VHIHPETEREGEREREKMQGLLPSFCPLGTCFGSTERERESGTVCCGCWASDACPSYVIGIFVPSSKLELKGDD